MDGYGQADDDGDSGDQPKVVDITDDFEEPEQPVDHNKRQFIDNRSQFFSSTELAKKELLAQDKKRRAAKVSIVSNSSQNINKLASGKNLNNMNASPINTETSFSASR
jgi:hypothetical protein